jgi:hypothetical protein
MLVNLTRKLSKCVQFLSFLAAYIPHRRGKRKEEAKEKAENSTLVLSNKMTATPARYQGTKNGSFSSPFQQ